MSSKMTIVLTTPSLPEVLKSYAANAARFGRLSHVDALVVGDRKTPPESAECVATLGRKWGFRAEYVDVGAQERWLARFDGLGAMIPYNSDNRRNVGFVLAYERGCDVLLSIDDDNYCTDDDFYGEHCLAGQVVQGRVASSTTGWFNIGTMLETTTGEPIFPRGFPFSKRAEAPQVSFEDHEVFVSANAGLWIGDPDVDAVSRLYRDVKVTGITAAPVLLGLEANAPVNTQNTAVWAAAVPAYYYVAMGHEIGGLKMDRYGDIWSGFFLKKCLDHLGHYCRFGGPVSRHVRNRHDLFLDLRQEIYGMMLTDPLVEMLASIQLAGGTYPAAYRSLSRQLERAVLDSEHPYFTAEVKAHFQKICSNMRIWVDVCQSLRRRGEGEPGGP